MKNILKFLLVPVFVGSTALTVVACGPNGTTVSDQDILESAVGQMQNHIFKMKQEFALNELPTGKFNENKNLSIRNNINDYYRNLVKSGDTWDKPDVQVDIVADKTESEFISNYGDKVEARVTLIAELKYKNEETKKDIVVKVTNDVATQQDRVEAIGNYLSSYLDEKQPIFNFKTLFQDNLTSETSNNNLLSIEANLKKALLKDTTKDNPFPIIDVEGVDITVEPSKSDNAPQVIYKLKDTDVIDDQYRIRGTIQNLDLIVIEGKKNSKVTGKTLNVAQSHTDAGSQITNILSQGPQALRFSVDTLPAAGTTLDNDNYAQIRSDIQKRLFEQIAIIYPGAKMPNSDSSEPWDQNLITFTNAKSSLFVQNENDKENSGYFLVDLKFDFLVKAKDEKKKQKEEVKILATVNGLKVNIIKNKKPDILPIPHFSWS